MVAARGQHSVGLAAAMRHGRLDRDTALGLKELRRRLEADGNRVPPSILDETVNLATWNVREFGRRPRLPNSLHCIAEVIGRFDLVALTEVRPRESRPVQMCGFLEFSTARLAQPHRLKESEAASQSGECALECCHAARPCVELYPHQMDRQPEVAVLGSIVPLL